MRAEAARIRRLRRLEKVRAIAKQAAATAAAEAEGTLVQLEVLAARTGAMIEDYRGRTSVPDGYALRLQGQFVAGISSITAATQGDAAQARATADQRQQDLAMAERRRAAVEERADKGSKALAQRLQNPALGGRKAVGTVFE